MHFGLSLLLLLLLPLLQHAHSSDGARLEEANVRVEPGVTADVHSAPYNPHKQIRVDVLEKYVPAIPVTHNRPMHVVVNLQLVMLIDVSEQEEAVVLNGWIMVFWTDESIRWNATKYRSDIVEFPSTAKLWVPDVTWYERIPLVEAYESDSGLFTGARALVKNNGDVYVSRGLLMKSHCALSMQNFPFDRQECNFTFSSNIHNTDRLTLSAVEKRKESLTDTASWTILGFPATCYNKTFRGVGTFNRVVFTLKMKRKPMFYIFYLMLPSFLISVLSCFVFLLPPQTPEKIPFCVNILLSLTVSMMIMTDMTPPTEEVPLLSIYFFVVLVLSMLVSGATIVIENVYDTTGLISCFMTRMCVGTRQKPQSGSAGDRQLSSPIRQDRTTSSAQAANLAHYFEQEQSETYCNSAAWTCAADEDDSADVSSYSRNKRGRRRSYVTRTDRLRAVRRLNSVCFAFSLSIALIAPILFAVYGLIVYPEPTRHSREM